jgi:NAD-dependent deacetylase
MDTDALFSDRLLARCANAGSIAVLTGAGVSAESGVPTFRDPGGLWSRYRPEDLANMDAFLANPDLVWEWYSWRRTLIADVSPNPGHYALAEMEGLYPDFTLITQNVDNLHRRAGSTRIIELHGNIEHHRCIACDTPVAADAAPPSREAWHCRCGGLIRPSVVWFGEMLPQDALRDAWDAAERAEVFFSIGTSGEVYPAAQLPSVAQRNGAYVVEINPRPSAQARHMHELIEGASGVVLPALLDVIRRSRTNA